MGSEAVVAGDRGPFMISQALLDRRGSNVGDATNRSWLPSPCQGAQVGLASLRPDRASRYPDPTSGTAWRPEICGPIGARMPSRVGAATWSRPQSSDLSLSTPSRDGSCYPPWDLLDLRGASGHTG